MDLQAVGEYADAHTTEEPPLLQELAQKTRDELEYSEMLSGRVVGRMLSILIKISGAKRILEVGTFTGYSALTMAEALPRDSEIYTCEYNERYEKIARSYFERSEFGSKITLLMGQALDTIPTIKGDFDFVYMDADKINYPNYYEMILPRLKKGCLMVIDNVLWSGEVLSPETDNAKAIDRLNKMIKEDDSVEHVMLTVRDGLTIVRKLD